MMGLLVWLCLSLLLVARSSLTQVTTVVESNAIADISGLIANFSAPNTRMNFANVSLVPMVM